MGCALLILKDLRRNKARATRPALRAERGSP